MEALKCSILFVLLLSCSDAEHRVYTETELERTNRILVDTAIQNLCNHPSQYTYEPSDPPSIMGADSLPSFFDTELLIGEQRPYVHVPYTISQKQTIKMIFDAYEVKYKEQLIRRLKK